MGETEERGNQHRWGKGNTGLPSGISGKELAANADVKDVGLIPGSGRSPGEAMEAHSSILA